MKKILIVIISILLATFVFTGDPSAVFAQKVLRLAETHPQDYPTTKGDYEFARLVKERSNGRIVVEVFHSKQLGEERAVIEQVQLVRHRYDPCEHLCGLCFCQRPRCLSTPLSLSRCCSHVEGIEWADWRRDLEET